MSSSRLAPYLFAIAIIAAFGAVLIGNGALPIKSVFAQIVPTPPPPSALPTVAFVSQSDTSVPAADDDPATSNVDETEDYIFTITTAAATANASIGTIPPAIIWNTQSQYRALYTISTDAGDGADHDKFDINDRSGAITIASGQTSLSANTYNITLLGRVRDTSTGSNVAANSDKINVAITVSSTVPEAQFASQDDPSVAAADNASYSYTVPQADATANAAFATVHVILVNAASDQRANFSIGTESGHGADHASFAIEANDSVSGALTIGGTDLTGGTYNITLVAEVYDSGGSFVNGSVTDTIDVEIDVIPPEAQFASQDDPSVAAPDNESYTFTFLHADATANAAVHTAQVILVNAASGQRANFSIGTESDHGADHASFAIDAVSGALTIGGTALSVQTYNITLVGEVYDSGGSLVNGSVADTIDVEIDVIPPEAQFTEQDGTEATGNYEFHIHEDDAIPNAVIGTVQAVIVNEASSQNLDPRFSIVSTTDDPNAGDDHDSFAIDATSGTITIASTLHLLVDDSPYEITLKAEVHDSGGALVSSSVADTIDVEIDVISPEVHFADQDDPSVAIADNESYLFTVLERNTVAGGSVGTVQAILVKAASSHRPNFSIGTESGHGADHASLAIDAVSGALTVAGQDLTAGTVYDITLVAEVYDSNDAHYANSTSDEIDVAIEVIAPEAHFAKQSNPGVAAGNADVYDFIVLDSVAVAGELIGTAQAFLVKAASSHRLNFRIGTESGHGADHASLVIDAVSGAITVAGQDLIGDRFYNITLVAEVYDSDDAHFADSISDEIDVAIEVVTYVEELKVANQDDPDTAAEDDETYAFQIFPDTDVIGTIRTDPPADKVNRTESKTVFTIRDSADGRNFAISRLGELSIAVDDLPAGVYNIVVDVSLRDDADGAYRSPDSIEVQITAVDAPTEAMFLEGAPKRGTVEAPIEFTAENTSLDESVFAIDPDTGLNRVMEPLSGKAVGREVLDISDFVDDAGGHDVSYEVVNADDSTTDLFEFSDAGVLMSTELLRFHDDDEMDIYELKLKLRDDNLGGIDPDELEFTVTVTELSAKFAEDAPEEGMVEAEPSGSEEDAEAMEILDFGEHVDIPIEVPALRNDPDTVADDPEESVLHEVSYEVSDTVNFQISEGGLLQSTDALRFYDDPDRDEHELTITIRDETVGEEDEHTITVTVDGVPPKAQAEFDVLETQGAGDIPGALVRFEDSNGDLITDDYFLDPDLSGDASEVFAVSDEGQISVLEAAIEANVLDLDAGGNANRYILTIKDEDADGETLGIVTLDIIAVDEPPVFDEPALTVTVDESKTAAFGVPYSATDPEGTDVTFTLKEPEADTAAPPFVISAAGQLSVAPGETLDADAQEDNDYALTIVATDETGVETELEITVTVLNANDKPEFAEGTITSLEIPETHTDADGNVVSPIGTELYNFDASDADDGDTLDYKLRDADDTQFFAIHIETGVLTTIAELDYEPVVNGVRQIRSEYGIEVLVEDDSGATDEVLLLLTITNVNDNAPEIDGAAALSVAENTVAGVALSTYTATDPDGDEITFSIDDEDNFTMDGSSGVLSTEAPLDYESRVSYPVTVTASDGLHSASLPVTITVTNEADGIESIDVSKANPVPAPLIVGDPNTALGDTRTDRFGRPDDLPATDEPSEGQTAPELFVETEHASWGTVLRIEVTAEQIDPGCDGGNCVVVNLEASDSDDTLNLQAYRLEHTPNKFAAAVLLVSENPTEGTSAVYKHSDGGIARLDVDEEDTLTIEFGGQSTISETVSIENEAPEFGDFTPEHEASIDDEEVEYSFTVTDALSGLPEPEDLPDTDGDDEYTSVVALVSSQQCHNVESGTAADDLPDGTALVVTLHDDASIYCPPGSSRYNLISDANDFDSIDDGFDVLTEIDFGGEGTHYVTFIACDAAGNCVAYDPDENESDEALLEITVDTTAPKIYEARTGVAWDASGDEYDDNRKFLQVVFEDASDLNEETIEADDFVVEGHTIARVLWYDTPDDFETDETQNRFAGKVNSNYRNIARTVFIELEDELEPDETPDVSVVPNGIEDEAANEQDDDEIEAEDWIAPKFTVENLASPLETPQSQELAGEDDKVVFTVSSDERLSATRPTITVTYVNAPAGCVNTNGVDGERGHIRSSDSGKEAYADCAESGDIADDTISSVVKKDTTNQWTVTVNKPDETGYYNIHISGTDRSPQANLGSEGVKPGSIVTNFFERDGDVNADDAHFFEADLNLPKPRVVISGVDAGETDPAVEVKSPLFIEIDFSSPFLPDCAPGKKRGDNTDDCTAETSEYAEDNFDKVTITLLELDGIELDPVERAKSTDGGETFLVSLTDAEISIGEHELKIEAVDMAGNELDDTLEIDFEVEERDAFTRRLNPGWNLVSLPGEPLDNSISAVFGTEMEVRTIYTYDPVVPGGWQVAVRETLESEWQGDLTAISSKRGYWILGDAIQDLEVIIPRLAGGASGTGTPLPPPSVPVYAGWNLIPVLDITGNALDTDHALGARDYLQSLDDGLDLARVLGFDTITNQWHTVLAPEGDGPEDGDLQIGSAYWIFLRASGTLVPGGELR